MTAGELRNWLKERESSVPDREEIGVEIVLNGEVIVKEAVLTSVEIVEGKVQLRGGYPNVEKYIKEQNGAKMPTGRAGDCRE